jgi:aminobenzoyl-glutamate utilization protein A
MNASEDCTAFMNRVVSRGGKATYMMFGSNLASNHHTPEFDFDEQTMTDASAFFAILALKYAK